MLQAFFIALHECYTAGVCVLSEHSFAYLRLSESSSLLVLTSTIGSLINSGA